jgi:hypothetical protein
LPGFECSSRIDGCSPEVEVVIDTRALEAGRSYGTTLRIDTNAGTAKVPVRFATASDWSTVVKHAGQCALAGGAILGAGRAVLALAGSGLERWFLSYAPMPYGEALAELERISRLDPGNRQAQQLRAQIHGIVSVLSGSDENTPGSELD